MTTHLHRHDPYRRATGAASRITDATEPREGPLRIVAWVDRYPPFPGCLAGGEMALHGMLRWLAERGHHVRVISPAVPLDATPATELDGVRLHPEGDADRVLAEHCDVLISHLLWTKVTRAAAIRARIPYVYLFHNDFTIPHWQLRPEQVTAVVFNTEWVRASTLARWSSWARVPQIVVRPPIRAGDYTVDTPGAARPFVTLVNTNHGKGGSIFYQLAERRPGLRFLGVEGAYSQQLRPKHPNTEWQPQTSAMRDDVYARTRVLVVPSEYESFGMAAVEAAAAGCAVVCSDTPGLREALDPAALFVPRLRGRRAIDPWLAALDSLDDPDVYDTAVRVLAEQIKVREAATAVELPRLELLLRVAANADPVASGAMSPRHDPFRRHAHSVESTKGTGEAPEAPVEASQPQPGGVGASEAERAVQAGITDPDTLEIATQLDQAATEGVLVGIEAPAAGTWSEEIEGGGAGEPLPPVDTQQGAGDDGPASGGDAGHTPDGEGHDVALTSETVAPGDGADSQDVGRTGPEPAPDTTAGPEPAPDSEGLGVDGATPASSPSVTNTVEPSDVQGRPPLVDKVPANATGIDGIVAWIETAPSEAERWDRAAAAEWVEDQRPAAGRKKRKAVMDAIGPVLYD